MILKRVGFKTPRLCAQMNALGAAFSCFGCVRAVRQVVCLTKVLLLRGFQCFVDETCWNAWTTIFSFATFWSTSFLSLVAVCEGSLTVSWGLMPWLSRMLFGSLRTVATSEMRHLADSGWWAMSGPKAIGLWHSSSRRSFSQTGT